MTRLVRRDDLTELNAALAADFGRLVEHFRGPRNRALSHADEWRWGAKGSFRAFVRGHRRGEWADFEGSSPRVKHDPLGFIQAEKHCRLPEAKRLALEYLGGAPPEPARVRRQKAEKPRAESTYHLRIVAESLPVAGTIAETYLRVHRKLIGPLPCELRFHPNVWHKYSKQKWPGLVVVARDVSGVRRVQVVFLDPATGNKAPIEFQKLTFGRNGAEIPAIFAPRHAGGPVRIFEGPENALTGWMLTGDCCIAVFGLGNLIKLQLPVGLHVVICGDGQVEERESARMAARHYMRAGCKVRLALPDQGIKDFNDGLRDIGPDAARRMLITDQHFREHGLPPYHPGPTEARDAALARQNSAISKTIRAAAERGFLSQEIARRRAVLITDDMPPAAKASISRQVKASVLGDRILAQRPRVLVTGSQGTGKTRSAIAELAALRAPLGTSGNFVVHYLAPTIDKAREFTIDYIDVADEDSLPVMVIYGRGQIDRERGDGSSMCPRHAIVDRAARRGVQVRKVICTSCPLAAGCGSMRQERQIAIMGKRGIFAHASAYAFAKSPAPVPDLVIGDEDITRLAIDDVLEMHPDALTDVVPFHGHDLSNVVAANKTINTIRDALASAWPFTTMKGNSIGEVEIKFARKMLDDAIEAMAPSISGELSDSELAEAIRQIDGRLPAVASLLGAIGREIHLSRNRFTGVEFDPARLVKVDGRSERQPRIRVHRLRRPVGVPADAGLLLLDGTGSQKLNMRLFGEMTHHHVPVERNAFVIGTAGKTYSAQSLTGLDRHGQALPNKAAGAKRLRHEVKVICDHMSTLSGGHAGIVGATKKAADMFRAESIVPDTSDVAHFGRVRGMNVWEDCRWSLSVGRESVSIQTLEDLARAFFADDTEPFFSFASPPSADWPYQQWPYRASRGRRMRDGTVQPIEVEVHPDLRCQEILEQLREAEITQTADRCRPIFSRRNIGLLNNLALDFTYDRVYRHEELAAGGDRLDIAWQRSGILPVTPNDLHRAHSDLFPSEDSASDALRAACKRGGLSQIISYLGNPPPFAYRRAGQRGSLSKALIDPRRYPDPARALSAVFGHVESIEALMPLVIPGPQVALPHEPPVALTRPSLEVVPPLPPAEGLSPAPGSLQKPLLLLFVGRPVRPPPTHEAPARDTPTATGPPT